MPDSFAITCPEHSTALIPSHVEPGALMCPDAQCATVVKIAVPDHVLPPSPLGPMAIQAARNHELVCTYEAAGFSRSEAMQILGWIVTAGVMKDRGGE